MAEYTVTIDVQSPLSLGSGQGDVNIDSSIIHDEFGVPYFPAKRFKGLLYESAVEVVEMAQACQKPFLTMTTVDELFHHTPDATVQLIVWNFYLPGYETMKQDWQYIQQTYKEYIQPANVLEEYTSLRYQTEIDAVTGVAKDHSLRNIRVVNAPLTFTGSLTILSGTKEHEKALALALQNLRTAGQKRNRGFGTIRCRMKGQDKIVKQALQEGGIR